MKNIYLTGPRACGKTTVGKMLAEYLKRPFVDTDQVFVEKHGQSIAECVDAEGWDVFRNREAAVLRELAGRQGLVVACGGGIVLREENRKILARGMTVYFDIDADELAQRLENDPLEAQRPSLTGKSLAEEVRDVLKRRDPMYRESAHVVITKDLPEFMVRTIARSAERFTEKT